jgi:hypothetical protein
MSAPPTPLSVAVRECRIRVARDDIYAALGPVSRHSGAARLSLELNDDKGLEHHLRHIVDGVRLAARKHRELRRGDGRSPSGGGVRASWIACGLYSLAARVGGSAWDNPE